MLRSGNTHAGIAATTSTTKGGEDTTNSQSMLDSLPDTDDESQGSESDTDSEAHRSDDQQSAEDGVSTSTTGAKMENHGRHSRDLDEEKFRGETPSEFCSDFKNATTAIRDEIFRLQKNNKELRGLLYGSRTEFNKLHKLCRSRQKTIFEYQEEIRDLNDQCSTLPIVNRRSMEYAAEIIELKKSMNRKEQDLDRVQDAHRKITKEYEELQQALADLQKLQATKEREEYKSTQDSGVMQERQLSKIARDLRKELEMEQLRDSIRKLNEDYKSFQGPGATRELQQSKTAHESSGEELKQIKIILEKLASDHEKLREVVQGTSSRSKEPVKPIGPSAESRVDDKKPKGSRSLSSHVAMGADVQDQSSSALDLVHSAIQKHINCQIRIKASGREWIPGPKRQIYVGNIAFNSTEDEVMDAINELTHIRVYDCTMPRSGDRNRGYAFVTIGWPSEFKHNGVDMDTFCDAIHRLDIKGRPIYAKEAHHRSK